MENSTLNESPVIESKSKGCSTCKDKKKKSEKKETKCSKCTRVKLKILPYVLIGFVSFLIFCFGLFYGVNLLFNTFTQ
jgi:hypothetical protein